MIVEIDEIEATRDSVMEKKFSDPAYVGQQYNNIMDVVASRNKCKKKFQKIKLEMRDIRKKIGDMNVVWIYESLDTRVNKVEKDLRDL
jgi:hypothetical protein